MGIRDEIRDFGVNVLGAIGGTMVDLAKARVEDKPSGESATSNSPVPTEEPTDEQKALMWDPYSIVEQLGYKDRPSSVTYGTLKSITYKLPIIQAIIQTRINQVASFCTPQKDKYKIGFKVKLRDQEKSPTKVEKAHSRDMERLLMTTGVCDDSRDRDSFEVFVRKVMFDSMVFDQATYETVLNNKGVPCQWYATDASTMRLADTASVNASKEQDNTVKYVQIYDSMIIEEFTDQQMYFGIRNPRSDIRLQGYGVSEIEMLITTITSLLYAHDHNTNFFKQGSAIKGIINFKGIGNEKMLQAFRRHWYTQVASTANAWKTPVTNSQEGLEFINMQTSSRDMEFNAWMDFLIKTAAAIFTIDPVEVNFQYGNTGQTGGIGGDSSNKEKIIESKERGLRPLLRFLAQGLNEQIIWPINDDFELEFVGLDARTKEEAANLTKIVVGTYKTIDEVRAEEDLEPLPDGKGEVILDPTWLQFAQMKEGGGEEEGGFGGGEGEEAVEQGEQPEEEPEEEEASDEDRQKMLAQYEDSDEGDEAEKSQSRTWNVKI